MLSSSFKDKLENKLELFEKMFKKQMILIFFLFLIAISLVDSINGFLLGAGLNMPISIGQVFRLTFIAFLLYLIIKNRQFVTYPIILITYLIAAQFFYYFFHDSIGAVFEDLIVIFKFLLIVIIIEAFKSIKDKGAKYNLIGLAFAVNIVLFPMSLLLPKLFGAGYSMYAHEVGYSGFFTAANDLNVVLLILFIFCLDLLSKSNKIDKKFIILCILSLMNFISLILLGSKSSMAFGALIIFVYIIVFFVRFPSKKVILSTIAGIVIFVGAFSLVFNEEIQKSFERHSYFFKKQVQDENNIFSFLITGRDIYLRSADEAYQESDYKLITFLVGKGMYQHGVEAANHFELEERDHLIIEMDFWDTFFSYGIIGVILIYGYFILTLYSYLKTSSIQLKYLLSFIIVLIYSSLGGHVLYSALSGTLFAMVCCGMYIKRDQPVLYLKNKPFF